jgi:hypothetical protein
MIPPAMTTLRIRIKTGESEFEAEGMAEDVNPQILTFLRLLGREDLAGSKPSSSISTPVSSRLVEVSKLMEVAGRTVSLNDSSGSLDEDVLLLLLGQQQLLGNAAVAGREIMGGLRASGHSIMRADHILKRYAGTGHIVVTGKRRRRRYRLSTDGLDKASKIARRLASSIPAPQEHT